MANINSISLDTADFYKAEESPDEITYYMNKYDSLIINFFNLPPDITAKDGSEKAIQDNYRKVAVESDGAIIEVKKIFLGKLETIKTIMKFHMKPSGMAYLGCYTIPFKSFSYVVKVQCLDVGTTGIRDTVICNMMLKDGIVKLDEHGIDGWMKDPYDETIHLPFMMNLSEEEKFDDAFPTHPLSRLRTYMKDIEKTFSYDALLENEPKFEYGIMQ